ncbi:MotE family protein [Falsigemmobacter intermedius]|uniref:Magnesium transporter MgtE intracellular domain-containing protein n=1 Tax=Falsigemmobacter intermedius TaxID=1553448 RepID=A0A3S3UB69_9RHOB|nr:hypothetical protein [Falsigemmobacter intermedius]RWY42968.1 hypothetical protein EP867_05655 [Falsigemmobacter intermedius]
MKRVLFPAVVMAALLPAATGAQSPAPVVVQDGAVQNNMSALDGAPAPKADPQQSRIAQEPGLAGELLAAIAAERQALKDRTEALNLRESEINFASAALAEQERQLTALKEEIHQLLGLAETRHSEDITRLVQMYRAMKPAEAAAILSNADLEVTVLVIAAMPERDSGPILARMNMTRAQAVSKIILERSRLPGDQRLLNLKIN